MEREDLLLKMMETLLTSDNKQESVEVKDYSYSKFLGEYVFIQTVTHYYTGKVKCFGDSTITLKDPAWIADTGRLSEFIKDPANNANEVEFLGNSLTINLGAVVSVMAIGSLPKETK